MSNKISARRYGRLLSVTYLMDHLDKDRIDSIPEEYIEKLKEYLPEFSELPDKVQYQITSFAKNIISSVLEQKEELIKKISLYSKNRKWEKFFPMDQSLLLIGTQNLQQDIPALIIKEILIICDMLGNSHAVPYISGILKSVAEISSPEILQKPIIKKYRKIRLKNTE